MLAMLAYMIVSLFTVSLLLYLIDLLRIPPEIKHMIHVLVIIFSVVWVVYLLLTLVQYGPVARFRA